MSQLRHQVDEIMDRWRAGEKPSALAALQKLPELWKHHSLAIDLAYEEYCIREESGEAVDPKKFCRQFSRLQHSLGRMLQVHGLMKSTSVGPPVDQKIDWPVPGEQWLDWLLVEEIGRGAFSRVFLAEEPSLGHRRVVIKCSTSGPGEAFLLGKCAHPNVMPIHTVRKDEASGLLAICMPFVGQVTLAQVLDRIANSDDGAVSRDVFTPEYGVWPDSVPQIGKVRQNNGEFAIEVARQVERVARGLEAAHQLKILHGDIKPSNIILSFAGQPLLVDFNLSVAEQAPQQRLGGTPPYMAPERLSLLTPPIDDVCPAATAPDFRSDVFSLGVVLYELLLGETPFEVRLDGFTASYVPTGRRISERIDVSGQLIPAELASIVERAIAIDPAERFPSATALAASLAEFVRKYDRQAHRKSRGWLIALVMLVVAPAVAIPVTTWALYQNTQPSAAPAPQAAPEPPRSEEHETLRLAIQDLETKDYVFAAQRLQSVQKSLARPEIAAWLGYCFAKLEQLPSAKHQWDQAKPEDDATGIVWHNLACCEMLNQLSQAALSDFDLALAQNPYLRESYKQRGITKTRLVMPDKKPPLTGTFDDLEAAISMGEDDAYLQFEAARSYAYGMKYDNSLRADAERCIRRALELGVPPKYFEGTTFKEFDKSALMPSVLPPPLPAPNKLEVFLPPAFDLRQILDELP